MKLWLRVALAIAVVSVAALLLTGVVAIRVAGDAATTTAERAQERDASAVAAQVDRWIRDREAMLLGWAVAFPLETFDAPRRSGLVRVVLTAMPSAIVVVLVDGNGAPVVEPAYFSPDNTPAGAIAGSATRAARLLEHLPLREARTGTSGTAVGKVFIEGADPSIPVAVAISDDPPLFLGAELSLDVVQELQDQASADHTVALMDRDGAVLTGGSELLDAQLLRPLLGTLSSIAYQTGGVSVQGAVSPVGKTGWSAVVLEPSDVALEGPSRIRRLLPLVVGVAMVLAVGLGLFLGRTVTEPIGRLRDSVLAVADGRLGVRAEVGSGSEVGELARAFNHMSTRLLDNQEEIGRQRAAIESFNQDLQREVDSATQELREAQEQLVRSGQLAAVAQIGAGLAHELNNPLTAVLGLTQLLLVRDVPESLREDLTALESEARRCREVVDALLKLSEGGETSEFSRSALPAIFLDVLEAVRPGFAQRGVDLQVQDIVEEEVAMGHGPAATALAQLMAGLAAGLPAGASLAVSSRLDAEDVVVQLKPSCPVALSSDDWMASGIDVWVARQTLHRLGADLVEPLDEDAPWLVRVRRA